MANRSRSCPALALLAAALLAAGFGCAAHQRVDCVPRQFDTTRMTDLSAPPGWRPEADPDTLAALLRSVRQENPPAPPRPGIRPLNALTLSGGGAYGAFDVGVLYGWTASGKRPEFDVVTGISTGALIAPFAFLGPQYDELLRDSYTNVRPEDVFIRRPPLRAALFSDSVASSDPLRKRIEALVTPRLMGEVAAAHMQGRRLYIGTTNLDTKRLVIWDMGAIAVRGTPQDLDLFRKVILASASVPGFFPPVYIDVEVNGRRYREMHVDGAVTAGIFLRASMLRVDPVTLRSPPGSKLYTILSGKLYADPACVRPQFGRISASAISSMLYAGSRSDLHQLFELSLVTGVEFNLMAVPPDFPLTTNSLDFDRVELQRLFEVGVRMGFAGQAWRKTPPGGEPGEQSPPRSGTRFATGAPGEGCVGPPPGP